MNAPVTRRALLGATAAVGAAGFPAVTEADALLATLQHPDAEIFGLLEAWGPARSAADAAGARAEALWNTFAEQEPARPAALQYRYDDDLRCGSDVEQLADGREVRFYGLQEVDKLRSLPLPMRVEETREPFPGRPDEVIVRRERLPDERRIARQAEVLAAHDVWWSDCLTLQKRLGIPAADDEEDRAVGALRSLEKAMLAATPATFAGLAAKARWATQSRLPPWTVEACSKQITIDVLVMAERRGAAS